MADLTITATSVVAQDGARVGSGEAGATITQGQPLYRDTNGHLQLAVNTGTTEADVVGIALSAGSDDNQVFFVTEGGIAIGAILTVGERYYVSSTAGKIHPSGDLVSTDIVTYLGTATSTGVIDVSVHASGAAIP